jgi:hypothetical protein
MGARSIRDLRSRSPHLYRRQHSSSQEGPEGKKPVGRSALHRSSACQMASLGRSLLARVMSTRGWTPHACPRDTEPAASYQVTLGLRSRSVPFPSYLACLETSLTRECKWDTWSRCHASRGLGELQRTRLMAAQSIAITSKIAQAAGQKRMSPREFTVKISSESR